MWPPVIDDKTFLPWNIFILIIHIKRHWRSIENNWQTALPSNCITKHPRGNWINTGMVRITEHLDCRYKDGGLGYRFRLNIETYTYQKYFSRTILLKTKDRIWEYEQTEYSARHTEQHQQVNIQLGNINMELIIPSSTDVMYYHNNTICSPLQTADTATITMIL